MKPSPKRKTTEVYMETRKDFPRVAAGRMLMLGMSQRGLARAAQQDSHSFVGRMLRGQVKTCETDTAILIANALDMPVDSLFLVRTSISSARHVQSKRPTAA